MTRDEFEALIWRHCDTARRRTARIDHLYAKDLAAAHTALMAAYDTLALDAARLDWLEARLREAYGVELDRTLGGFVASLTIDDGATTQAMSSGATLRYALDAARAAQPHASADTTHSAGAS